MPLSQATGISRRATQAGLEELDESPEEQKPSFLPHGPDRFGVSGRASDLGRPQIHSALDDQNPEATLREVEDIWGIL